MAMFMVMESRIENPILPSRILHLRSLIGSSVVGGFVATVMLSTFFLGTLYLEHVLRYSPLQTGLAFVPWTLTVGVLSLGITARLVKRFGPLPVLVSGMVTVIVALVLLSTAGADTAFFPIIFLAYFGMGLGIGNAALTLLPLAMADVPSADSGLGSGLLGVCQQVAGALGLAVLSTIATNHTKTLKAQGHDVTGSLIAGYHLAFVVGIGTTCVGIVVAIIVLRTRQMSATRPTPSQLNSASPTGSCLTNSTARAASAEGSP
jgi:MFS family permease